MEIENIFFGRRRKTEEEKLANIWRKKISCLWRRRKLEKEREENIWRRKGRKIFGEGKGGKYLEREREENICRRKISFFVEGKKNGQGKRGKYFEKEFFLWTRKRRKIIGEGKYFGGGGDKRRRKRRKSFGEGKSMVTPTDRPGENRAIDLQLWNSGKNERLY